VPPDPPAEIERDARRAAPWSARQRRSRAPGLRVQILLALAGVMLVAYVPLFFAIAQVARATSMNDREESARALGRAVAAHVGDVSRLGGGRIEASTLAAHVGDGGALAVAVFDARGLRVAGAGRPPELDALRAPAPPYGEAAQRATSATGTRALDVVLPAGDRAVVVRVRTDEDSARTQEVVRGVALYMGVFALALLVFAYIALTRALVRPIEQLARAADRVANGARSLDVPGGGAREIAELGASVRSMASSLLEGGDTLRAKVEELEATTRHLGETREQLEGSERMASVGRLAAGVAHEIGNPIAAIMGMHDLIEDAEVPAETRTDFLRRMRKETERINVVVRDLLDYARPENGPSSVSGSADGERSAHVSEIVQDALALVRPQKDWKGVEVSLDVDPELRVKLSPQRFTQILLNLLLNAAAAMSELPPGSPRAVTIRAREETPRESRGTGSPRPLARIEVEDSGPGVPADLRDRIFDPFVTTKDVGAGTGLGLSVCRGIVEAASGTIHVESPSGGGARFVVELERALAATPPA